MVTLDVVENPIIDVFDRLATAVEPIVGENCSMSVTEQVSDFPYFSVSILGNPTMKTDLEGNETHTTLSIQCESYVDGVGALIKAFKLDALAHKEMINMGFRRNYGPSVISNSQTSIKRVVSRYQRLLGHGQTI